jgi:hypothetical protein
MYKVGANLATRKRENAEWLQSLCEIYPDFSPNQWATCIIYWLPVGFSPGCCILAVFLLWEATRQQQIGKTIRS